MNFHLLNETSQTKISHYACCNCCSSRPLCGSTLDDSVLNAVSKGGSYRARIHPTVVVLKKILVKQTLGGIMRGDSEVALLFG